MQGLSLKSLKKNYSLIPLYGAFIVGLLGSTGYLLRLATRNPDVSWNKKKNPEPWQEYADKEYKFMPVKDPNMVTVKIPKY